MKRLLRYTLVGAIATAAHYVLLALCVETGAWPAWLASGFGAVIGAQVAYVGNRSFTFAYAGAFGASWLKFQATAAFGALLGMLIVGVAVHSGWHYLVAQAAATVVVLLLTFAVNRVWSFR